MLNKVLVMFFTDIFCIEENYCCITKYVELSYSVMSFSTFIFTCMSTHSI